MPHAIVKVGDILDEVADVMICPANPWLNMSGGVNGAILSRGGEAIQQELQTFLRNSGQSAVAPGTVVRTGPGPLQVQHILHAVAIDPFYDSSVETVRRTLERALDMAQELGAMTVVMPALATGYGHLAMEEFGTAFAQAINAEW